MVRFYILVFGHILEWQTVMEVVAMMAIQDFEEGMVMAIGLLNGFQRDIFIIIIVDQLCGITELDLAYLMEIGHMPPPKGGIECSGIITRQMEI